MLVPRYTGSNPNDGASHSRPGAQGIQSSSKSNQNYYPNSSSNPDPSFSTICPSASYLIPPPLRCPVCRIGIIRAVATVEKWAYPIQCSLCDKAYEMSGLRGKPLPEAISPSERIHNHAWYRQQQISKSNVRLPPKPISDLRKSSA